MKILAIETSAKSVSAAVVENGVPLASAYQNMGLTHSRTLMPLVDGMLSAAGLRVQDMDLLAAANGPGSFTGLRIGVSALKGLAWALEKPCCGVSTLAAMARNLAHMEGLIICAMDARRPGWRSDPAVSGPGHRPGGAGGGDKKPPGAEICCWRRGRAVL